MKKRFIACIVACALLLMGTGYAYWTDKLTVAGTVSTGELNVKLEKLKSENLGGFTDAVELDGEDLSSEFSKADGYINLLSLSEKSAKVTVSDMYPGYAHTFKFTAKNFGTVAAKLSKILVSTNNFNNDYIKKAIGINLKVTINDVTYKYVPFKGYVPEPDSKEIVDYPTESEDDFYIQGTYFKSLYGLSEIAVDQNTLKLDTYLVIVPDTKHECEIELTIGMNPDAAGKVTSGTYLSGISNVSDAHTENFKNGTVTLDFLWDQYNAKAAEVVAE